MAVSAQVVQKKNEKHSHTEGKRKKASGCSGAGSAAPGDAVAPASPWRSSSASRLSTNTTSTNSANAALHSAAVRHEPVSVVMPIM